MYALYHLSTVVGERMMGIVKEEHKRGVSGTVSGIGIDP